jgi:hypothetical protein
MDKAIVEKNRENIYKEKEEKILRTTNLGFVVD